MRARSAAHRVLSRAPDSPLGLALLADACEMAHLDAEVALRRAEARLLLGDPTGALAKLGATDSASDGRAAAVRGRALAAKGDPAAFAPLLRAMVLDVPGASESLSATLAWVPSDDTTRARIRAIVDAKEEGDLARWRAAFARAAGDRALARAALEEAVTNGDATAAGALLDAAIEDRDHVALARALGAIGDGDHAAIAADARHL